MLAKAHRLPRSEFNRIFQLGKTHHNQYFTLITSPTQTFKGAVVVGKKVAASAVERNRYRRQLYGVLERTLFPTPPRALIMIVKPPFAKLTAAERRVVAQAALAQLGKVG